MQNSSPACVGRHNQLTGQVIEILAPFSISLIALFLQHISFSLNMSPFTVCTRPSGAFRSLEFPGLDLLNAHHHGSGSVRGLHQRHAHQSHRSRRRLRAKKRRHAAGGAPGLGGTEHPTSRPTEVKGVPMSSLSGPLVRPFFLSLTPRE